MADDQLPEELRAQLVAASEVRSGQATAQKTRVRGGANFVVIFFLGCCCLFALCLGAQCRLRTSSGRRKKRRREKWRWVI
jgi:hypothetical protein